MLARQSKVKVNSKRWDLSRDEVWARLGNYDPPEVTDRLEDFGRLLLDANRERTQHLESKAILVVGYCLAVLAFVVSREMSVIVGWQTLLIRGASVAAATGLCCAFAALRVRSYVWFTDSQWFESENGVIDDADWLKRCHVMALHAVNSELNASNDTKAEWIIRAQLALIVVGLFIGGWAMVR